MSTPSRTTRRARKESSVAVESSEPVSYQGNETSRRKSSRLSGKQLPAKTAIQLHRPAKPKVFESDEDASDEDRIQVATLLAREKKKLLMSPSSSLAEEVGALNISDVSTDTTPITSGKRTGNFKTKLQQRTPEKKTRSRSDSQGTPEKKSRNSNSSDMTHEPSEKKKDTEALKGRKEEFESVKTWILDSKNNKTSLSIYISGQPGTGKTATTLRVLKALGHSVRSCIVNCASTSTKIALFKTIFESLELDGKPNVETFANHVKSFKTPLVLVLDEIDHLASRKNAALYAAFQWPETLSYKVIILGIANSIDLTERLLPKLMLTKPPKRLVFEPYTKDDIVEILNEKMRSVETQKLDAKAIELTARKVAAMSGDLRTALHIFKQQKSLMISTGSEPGGPATPINGCREVLGIINNVYSSPLARARLPLQPRILLAVALALSSNKKCVFDRNSLLRAYYKACEGLRMPALDDDDLHSAFQTLESQSFIRQINGGKLVLQVDAPTAKSAISDNAMLDQIGLLQF